MSIGIYVLKDSDLIKLRAALSARREKCEQLFAQEFTEFPESLTKRGKMYQSSKSSILDIFENKPSLKKSINNTCVIVDFSAVIRSKAAVSKAETFLDFANDIIQYIKNLIADSEIDRIDILLLIAILRIH